MPWLRYIFYFVTVAFVTWALTQMELASPGSLKLHILLSDSDRFGTSEFSPVEIIQAIILLACGAIMGWVAKHCLSQRPLAILFGSMALAFLIRELDYFLDSYVVDNFWQVIIGIVGALVIAYSFRHRRRLQIALARIWPSPGITLLFSGAIILFAFVRLVGHEPLWMSLLGDDYRRIVKLAFEEFVELIGYFLWMIGTIEYAVQARAISRAEPQGAVQRRRKQRRNKAQGRY